MSKPRLQGVRTLGKQQGVGIMVNQLAVMAICVSLVGCTALRLSSRGAPDEEMRGLELQLEAVDLPAAHGGQHPDPQVPKPLFTTIPEMLTPIFRAMVNSLSSPAVIVA